MPVFLSVFFDRLHLLQAREDKSSSSDEAVNNKDNSLDNAVLSLVNGVPG